MCIILDTFKIVKFNLKKKLDYTITFISFVSEIHLSLFRISIHLFLNVLFS